MAKDNRINLKPHFKEDGAELPCEGAVGDLYVFSPLAEKDKDTSKQGLATLWFCTKGGTGEERAIWKRVQFDGILQCDEKPPNPPQLPKVPGIG